MVVTVLPRPWSSARMPPDTRRLCSRRHIQASASFWCRSIATVSDVCSGAGAAQRRQQRVQQQGQRGAAAGRSSREHAVPAGCDAMQQRQARWRARMHARNRTSRRRLRWLVNACPRSAQTHSCTPSETCTCARYARRCSHAAGGSAWLPPACCSGAPRRMHMHHRTSYAPLAALPRRRLPCRAPP